MSAKHIDAELECCEEHIVHTDAVMAARSAMPAEEITTAASASFFEAGAAGQESKKRKNSILCAVR